MAKLTSNLYSAIALIIVAATLVLFVGVLPQLRKITALNQQMKTNRVEAARLEREVENYRRAAADLVTVSGLRVDLVNMFPLREQMVGLVVDLEEAADLAAITIDELGITDHKEETLNLPKGAQVKIPPPEVPSLGGIEEIPHTLQTSGSFTELLDFIYRLENQPFFTELTKLAVTAEVEQNERTEEVFNTGRGLSKIEGVLFIRQ